MSVPVWVVQWRSGRRREYQLLRPGCVEAVPRKQRSELLCQPRGHGELVTSDRGVVASLDVESASLVVRTDDDRLVVLGGAECSAERLDHGYATTVHRAQGATVERAHVFADGGGRELGYLALSRAKEENHVYVVADDLHQARDDLRREWQRERRPTWAIDTALPAMDSLTTE